MNKIIYSCGTFIALSTFGGCATTSQVPGLIDSQERSFSSDPETFLRSYLYALGRADYAEMKAYADDEVVVYAGSTLLDSRYGGLGGKAGRQLNQTVSEDAWIAAYDRAIKQLGGIEDYIERRSSFYDDAPVLIITQTDARFQNVSEPFGLQPKDILCIVNPQGDAGIVVLRRGISDRWYVVGEFWD